jgi:hypothetical protein
MALRVIGAGFGRTGTLSLRAALEALGFAPCHHMMTVFERPALLNTWQEALRRQRHGEPIDVEGVLGGFQATVDWPGCTFWRELIAANPDARVILSVRDPDRWYDSVAGTIYALTALDAAAERGALLRALPPDAAGHLREMVAFVDDLIWQGTFHGRFPDREAAIRIFNAHNAAVQAAVPPGRLLVYEIASGRAPLCAFLDVPVPAGQPFPHANDSETFRLFRSDPEEFLRRVMPGRGA